MVSDRGLVAILRTAAVTAAVVVVGTSAALLGTGHADLWWSEFQYFPTLFGAFFAAFVWLVGPREPRNAVVWVAAAASVSSAVGVVGLAGAALATSNAGGTLTDLSLVPADLPPAAALSVAVTRPFDHAGVLAVITFGLLLFPDGKLPSPRWRGVAYLAAAGLATLMLSTAWTWRPTSTLPPEQTIADIVGYLSTMAAAALSLLALVGRFRRSSGATRQQLKWIVWGASALVPTLLVGGILVDTAYRDWLAVPAGLGVGLFVTAYTIAVARYRLYEIDRIISRTAAYAVVTALLVAIYAGLVLLFGTALRPVTADSDLDVAASVLVVAALFQPVRRRVHAAVDRRFNRTRYDAQQTVAVFGERLREEVDLDTLTDELTGVVAETVQPARVSLWLPPR